MTNWDYGDVAKHSSSAVQNRLKSASTLSVVFLDRKRGHGSLYSLKTGIEHIATHQDCSCKDYAKHRSCVLPCMHMLRIAMEVGMMPWFTRSRRLRVIGVNPLSTIGIIESQRLMDFQKDESSWGSWSPEIHRLRIQHTRQLRGYDYWASGILLGRIRQVSPSLWIVCSSHAVSKQYYVSLSSCGCLDYRDRQLPCKHIYAVVIGLGCRIPISEQFYKDHQDRGLW